MAGDDVWTFISYAHDDNLPTGGGQDEEGFVSFLQRMIEVKLKDLGAPEAKLWRDAKRFSDGDPYDVAIEDALKKSALLIVVMSKNWLSRPYCQKELQDFIQYRQSAVANIEERIVVVGKRYVPKESWPAPLRVQEPSAFWVPWLSVAPAGRPAMLIPSVSSLEAPGMLAARLRAMAVFSLPSAAATVTTAKMPTFMAE